MSWYFIAGHGEGDPGAVGNGHTERELTVKVVEEICKLSGCEHYPFEKNAFKHTGELKKDIPAGTDVLEIHFNSFTSSAANGTEIYPNQYCTNSAVWPGLVKYVSEKIGWKNRGVKTANLAVINALGKYEIPAALLEICFISSAEDMKKFDAKKVATAIVNYLGIKTQAPAPTTHWADVYMQRLKKMGIMTDARPADVVTRGELAAVICRVLDMEGKK